MPFLSRAAHALRRAFAPSLSVALAAGTLAATQPARAEGTIRVAEQFGVVYLMLNVARDQHFIEQEGHKAGVDIKVDWVRLSGGAAVNDALLSGAVDIAGAGVGPLLTVWDRTHGRQNVKGVASLGNLPYYLVSTDPNVKTVADFTDKDRIAVPAVGVSVQSRVLQYAAAKQWGDKQFDRLDKLTQAIPHPDAAAALIANSNVITAHFGNPPFQQQELAGNPKAHIVLNSYDVLGGPSSATVLYTTQKFRDENPKTYHAFVAALADAAHLISTDPEKAADIYIRVNGSKIDRNLLLKILRDPQVQFKTAPQNTLPLAQFMYRTGAIRNEPKSWRDYFFDDPATAGGS
ncbi:ABC transporter substrate-binding protein [Paraburkholderia tropica]|jgi:NitT/TauT family transport system substrate-binding protein|uniref:NitT/TauT family transport system substrate-binding protein n=1 Tax=Paraburkholderia tropica TaxID=92647 RepID=A0A1A5XI82_9BURK|nr:ABC transporter substrate-binding protein [Paraburkholderia tropica]MBB2984522.1 NitT/TauT family transport system substrate-binding protein [Paraburkholderia tropica]OBR53206.1 nitrate ABC transporter substrate-binding protein [Paraburkholderia tropica]QNB15447.1 ABC transporter substrate-binding protein [Paraburkholderia tropica]RQN34038.1 ABC transporter substrate-binding protein [Paraburkholderia tropica]SEK12412.1 NitT/TauT family transport system substrate-binding protein [Paraburkhol